MAGSFCRRNFKGLQINPAALAPLEELPRAHPNTGLGLKDEEVAMRLTRYNLDPNNENGRMLILPGIRSSDIEYISDLGYGNGGTVTKVLHKPSGKIMAHKSIWMDSSSKVRKNVATELETLRLCDSDFIVRFYGQYIHENKLVVCMEFMNCGSLDKIYRQYGPLSEDVLMHVNAAVVDGLVYLKQLHITHRDIKPSNILVNHDGHIKLCDFGVSGTLVDSIAQTFVGTSMYMSPERVQGDNYTDAADVWSLGISLVELAIGRFPLECFDASGEPLPIFEMLQKIVEEPSPNLPPSFSPEFREYVSICLQKNKSHRIKVRQLDQTQFYKQAHTSNTQSIREWAAKLPML